MPDSSDVLIKNIVHYQKSLERYSQTGNDEKMLQCIWKLENLPITVTHLEKTGIGRTVNSLRKLGNGVGDAAKTLVTKWKEMVSGNSDHEESESSNTNVVESDNGCQVQNRKENESNSSHKHSDKYRSDTRKEKSTKESKQKSSKEEHKPNKHNSYISESKHKPSNAEHRSTEKRKEVKHENSLQSDSESDSNVNSSSESEQSYSDKNDRKSNHKNRDDSVDKRFNQRDSGKDRKSDRSRSREKTKKHDSHSNRHNRKHSSSCSDSEYRNKDHSNTAGKSSSKRKYNGSSDEETETKMLKKSSSHDSNRSSSSHKSRESSSRDKHEVDKRHSKSASKNDRYDGRKHDSHRSKSEDKNKKESSSNEKKLSSKSKSKHTSKSSSSNNKIVMKSSVEIGSESGTSFADALGMLEPTTSKSSKKSRNSEPSYRPDKPIIDKTIKEIFTPEKPVKSEKVEVIFPPPPPQKMEIDIESLLPTITPNYRPVSNPFLENANSRNKIMNEDEALRLVMSQKNQRTKVYSGNKCFYGSVPTLFELCTRILQDNIDALEYTGGVPYAILKPILDKATPDQLFVLEHHNPYLIEDTDRIWQFHCQKEFRNRKREELESWREMYMRCLDEREAKLKALTENIKLAQDKSTPVRQTKLAYIDSVVKPPRDVLRKQAKNGIDKKPVITPSARLSALTTSGTAGQVSVPNPVRASSSGTSSAIVKQKKAPLMQKTLAFLKGNRFRR